MFRRVYIRSYSLSRPLLYRFLVVVLFGRGHPRFRDFNFTIRVDVIRVKSSVGSQSLPQRAVADLVKGPSVPGLLLILGKERNIIELRKKSRQGKQNNPAPAYSGLDPPLTCIRSRGR